ncbi:MAG: hypothetical protein K6F87_07920 [Lachnospiraceae bacterium]|nr:hypothetical protein [Lachnospiraceae bacterium]
MHVGCCENCRFIDLVEDHPDGCPRCGGKLVSLCVDTVHWNRLNAEGRRSLIMHILTEPKLRPLSSPEFELDPDQKENVISALVKKADERDVQVRHAENEIFESRMVEKSINRAQQELARSVINEKLSKQRYAYFCCKCNYTTEKVRQRKKFLCPACGSEMLDSGYKIEDWTALSGEERVKIIANAQFEYIVRSIKNNPIDQA